MFLNPMSQLKIRELKEEDYSTLCDWWKWHRFPIPPMEILPDNGLGGLMVEVDGIDICAGFLYLTNSKICWIEYIVSNPSYREENRKEVIKTLIERLSEIAKNLGFKVVYSSVVNENLLKTMEELGFNVSKSNSTVLVL